MLQRNLEPLHHESPLTPKLPAGYMWLSDAPGMLLEVEAFLKWQCAAAFSLVPVHWLSAALYLLRSTEVAGSRS